MEIKEWSKVQVSHEISENQKSNILEDALAIQIAFEDLRINKVEKIDQRDLLMILNKHSLILQIEFVILGEFKDVKIKAFLFTQLLKDWCKYLWSEFLSFNYLKIEVEYSLINMSKNQSLYYSFKWLGNVMTCDKIYHQA